MPSPDDQGMTTSEFDTTVRLRRNVKSRMGLAFTKGQTIQVKHSPAEYTADGYEILPEHWTAVHPLYKNGTDDRCTIAIPLRWAEKVAA